MGAEPGVAGILVLFTELLSVEVEPRRERNSKDDGNASKHRVSRSVAELVDHLLTKERESEAQERTEELKMHDRLLATLLYRGMT